MRKIRLANNAEYEIDRCGASQNGNLWIGFPPGELTIAQAAQAFSDAEATAVIVSFFDFGMEETYEGYTELIVVQTEYEGGTLIALRRG